LKLHKNLYGLKQAGHNWYEKLKHGMELQGFKPCHSDPCMYTQTDIIVLVYVDDMLIFSRSMQTIKKFMQSLDTEYIYTDEGDIKSYLGIDVSKPVSWDIQIVPTSSFKEHHSSNQGHETKPVQRTCTAPHKILVLEGEPRKTDWNYRSILGQLN
jgi:hypothetical protein